MRTDDSLLTITQAAAIKFRQIRFCQARPGAGLRISVLFFTGCTGPAYYIGLEETAQPDDFICRYGDITMYVSTESAEVIRGGVLDYLVTPDGEGFVVHLANPIPRPCGRCPDCIQARQMD